jgi:HSP20 family molecular chaperone IbpA
MQRAFIETEGNEVMAQQSSIKFSVSNVATLPLVSSDEITEHTQGLFDSIARRAFRLNEGRGHQANIGWDDWRQAESEIVEPIAFEISESREHIVAQADISGYGPNDLRVCVEPRSLTVSGSREEQERVATQTPMGNSPLPVFAKTMRIFQVTGLPSEVDPLRCTAGIRESTLEVLMPKALSRTRRIRAKVQ